MTTVTRLVLEAYIIDTYGIGRRGTNTGTVATSVTDDADFGGGDNEGVDVGCQIAITSGNRIGDITNLASRPKLTSGLVSVDPNFGGALANADTFNILYKPFRFTGGGVGLRDRIQEAQALFTWERRIVPITNVTDGDMLSSVTTDWDEDQSGAPTLSKAVLGYPYGLPVLTMTGAANAYTGSQLLDVEPAASYYFEATGVAGTGDGTLVLRDVTNAASITLDESAINRTEPQLLVTPSLLAPSGCESMRVRLLRTSTGGTVIVYLTNVILRRNDQTMFTLQDRPQRVLQIGQVRATNTTDFWQRSWELMEEVAAEPQQVGAGLWQIHLKQPASGLSLWYEEFIQPAALTTDTGTTAIPRDDLAAVTAELLLRPLQDDARWKAKYKRAARDASRVLARYGALQTARHPSSETYALPYA